MGTQIPDLQTDQESGPCHGKMFELASKCRKVELKRILFMDLKSAGVGTNRIEKEANRLRKEQAFEHGMMNKERDE